MTVYAQRPNASRRADYLGQNAQVLSIVAFFVVCVVFFSLTSVAFFSSGNLLNMLRQSAPILIVAVAMTFVITTDRSTPWIRVIECRRGIRIGRDCCGCSGGGTSLMGCKGTFAGTVLGALTIAVIVDGLILWNVSPFYAQIVTGLIILVAIWLNTRVFARLAAPVRKT